jgi:hypothetical protein
MDPIQTPRGTPASTSSQLFFYLLNSLLSKLSKLPVIPSRIIAKHMFNYAREHNIITEHQSGFQPIDSTVNQLLHIYHTIISNLDVGKLVSFRQLF